MDTTSSAHSSAKRRRFRFADLVLDVGRRRVSRNGEPVQLSRLSFDCLRVLVEAAPNLVDHDTLAHEVWGPSRIVTPENLTKRVLLLRQALGDHADEPRYVESLRGQGYRLVPPVELLPSADIPAARPAPPGPTTRQGRVAALQRPRVGLVAGLLTASLALVAAAGIMSGLRDPAVDLQSPTTLRFEVVPEPDRPFVPTEYVRDLAISPNAAVIAYKSDENSFVLRQLDRIESRRLSGLGNDVRSPAFSPDGSSLAFLDGSVLKKVPTSGRGISEPIATVGQFTDGDMHWAADGSILIANSRGLQRVAESGGPVELLAVPDRTAGELWFDAPYLLPGGRAILFSVVPTRAERGIRIAVHDLASGQRHYLLDNATQPAFLDTGHLIFASDNDLRAVAFDPVNFEVGAEQITLADEVLVNTNRSAHFSVARDGTLVYAVGDAPTPASLVWVSRDGVEQALDVPAMSYTYPRLSPDGSRLALDVRWPDSDIWIWELERSVLTRLTNDPAENVLPVWHTNGRELFFGDGRSGVANVYRQAADGARPPEPLLADPRRQLPFTMTPDGRSLIIGAANPRGDWHMHVLELETGRARPLLAREHYSYWNTDISPDGRWLVYQSDESGRLEIYISPFPDTGSGRLQISANGGSKPMWSRDGREVFYISPSLELMAADLSFEPRPMASAPRVELDMSRYSLNTYESGARPYDLSRDGERFLILRDRAASEAAGDRRLPRIVVSVDWTHELERRLPGSVR